MVLLSSVSSTSLGLAAAVACAAPPEATLTLDPSALAMSASRWQQLLAGQGSLGQAPGDHTEAGPTILMMSTDGLRRWLRRLGEFLSPSEAPAPTMPAPEPPPPSHLREYIRGERITCLADILAYQAHCFSPTLVGRPGLTLKYTVSRGAEGPELRLGHPVYDSHPDLSHYRVIGAGMMAIERIEEGEGNVSRYRIKIDGESGLLRTLADGVAIDPRMSEIGYTAARPCGLKAVRSILAELLREAGDTVEIS